MSASKSSKKAAATDNGSDDDWGEWGDLVNAVSPATAEKQHQARVEEYLKQLQQFLMDAVDPATFEVINSSLQEQIKTRGGWEGFVKYYEEHPELVWLLPKSTSCTLVHAPYKLIKYRLVHKCVEVRHHLISRAST